MTISEIKTAATSYYAPSLSFMFGLRYFLNIYNTHKSGFPQSISKAQRP